jgi:hypothetical protein
MLVIRQEQHDLAQAEVDYNVIKHNPLGSAEFVNPNFDVACLEAWIAVDDRTPALLEVPEITGRYYTAQILDEWGEVIVNINERTFRRSHTERSRWSRLARRRAFPAAPPASNCTPAKPRCWRGSS